MNLFMQGTFYTWMQRTSPDCQASESQNSNAMRDGHYHTEDIAQRDADGYITFVGHADDVFKASDYRINPFELESVLMEHDAVRLSTNGPSKGETALSRK